MKCGFTYNHYDDILKLINKNNYKSQFFNMKQSEKNIILRHDIDIDLNKAYKIAEIEEMNNIRSTYFIWLSSPFYNIFDPNNKKIINKILSKGHQIGLHFYDNENLSIIEENIKTEIGVIENCFETSIKSISFHKPSKLLLAKDFKFNNLINAYDNDFFRKYKYISDSRGMWSDECICKVIESNKFPNIQLLTHPIWWNEYNITSIDAIRNYLKMKNESVDVSLRQNISIYNG